MNLRNLANAIPLLTLAGMLLSVRDIRADEHRAQTTASPPMTFERRDALELAAADPTLSPWQRKIMLTITRGTSQHKMGDADAFTPQRIATTDDGEWVGLLPPRRCGHTAIYDPVRDRMVVFGGYDAFGDPSYRNDVWALRLSGKPSWSALNPSGSPPSRRYGHTAIYDPLRDRMVVFGGSSSGYNNQVWALTLSGSPAWSALSPSGSPPPGRQGHTAFYDPVRDRMVVFAGFDAFDDPPYRNDVWTLTLSGSPAWSALAPSGSPPPRRYLHAAIYDPVRDRMVVFGGLNVSSFLNDMWALTLSASPTWSALSTSGSLPPGRYEHTALYDPVRDRMVIFGGYSGSYRNDVWELKLSGNPAWSEITPTGNPPPVRYGHTAFYDPVREQMLVFGGYDGSYRGDVWALTLSGSPAWSALIPSGSPPPGREGHTALYDPVRDQMVVFGGFDGSGFRDDVWLLTLSVGPTWSALAPSGSAPSRRVRHTAIYDPMRDQMVVFGGYDGNSQRNDVRALMLSGTPVWSELAPSGSLPPERHGHTAIYDAVRDRMVVFGGYDGLDFRNDVWALTLSGSPAWNTLAPSGSLPPGLYRHTALYDPARDRMVVFGGHDGSIVSYYRNEVWDLSWDFHVDDVPILNHPSRLLLHAARPNPVHSFAEIRYEITSDGHVSLEVLDIQGRVMRRLRHGIQSAGTYSVVFDRRDDHGRYLPAGMYLIRLRTRNEPRMTRIVVLP